MPANGFVEQDEFRFPDKRTGDFQTPAFSSGQVHGVGFFQSGETEIFKQYIRPFFLLLTGKARMLQNNLKILTHRKFSEDGTLLREVRNAHTCALMERPRAQYLDPQGELARKTV